MKACWVVVEIGVLPEIRVVYGPLQKVFVGKRPVTDFPGSIGHYDWLRNHFGVVIGVRLWPFNDDLHMHAIRGLLSECSRRSYVMVDGDKSIAILLKGSFREIDDDASNDQDLGDNGLLVNSDMELSLYFKADESVAKQLMDLG
jgi:hypothetical protein